MLASSLIVNESNLLGFVIPRCWCAYLTDEVQKASGTGDHESVVSLCSFSVSLFIVLLAVIRHLGFYRTGNSAIRSADHKTPG